MYPIVHPARFVMPQSTDHFMDNRAHPGWIMKDSAFLATRDSAVTDVVLSTENLPTGSGR